MLRFTGFTVFLWTYVIDFLIVSKPGLHVQKKKLLDRWGCRPFPTESAEGLTLKKECWRPCLSQVWVDKDVPACPQLRKWTKRSPVATWCAWAYACCRVPPAPPLPCCPRRRLLTAPSALWLIINCSGTLTTWYFLVWVRHQSVEIFRMKNCLGDKFFVLNRLSSC